MASFSSKIALLCLVAIFANSLMATVADPDITSDFIVPTNVSAYQLNGNFFTFNGIHRLLSSDKPKFKINEAKYDLSPGDYEGVALATAQFFAGAVNPPNTLPYSAELLFLLEGTLEVGFLDTSNKLYSRTLQVGDMFVFPKGLAHFYYNPSNSSEARVIIVYGGFPAPIFFPTTLLSSGVDDGILAQSFKIDLATIQKLKAGLGSYS